MLASIGNIKSDIDTIKCGDRKVVYLGPLLFLIYIKDITKSSNILNFLLFADDTCLSFSYDESNNETEQLFNQEKRKISTSKLTLNVDKSNYLIFSTGKKKKLNLTMNNEILQEKEHIYKVSRGNTTQQINLEEPHPGLSVELK